MSGHNGDIRELLDSPGFGGYPESATWNGEPTYY